MVPNCRDIATLEIRHFIWPLSVAWTLYCDGNWSLVQERRNLWNRSQPVDHFDAWKSGACWNEKPIFKESLGYRCFKLLDSNLMSCHLSQRKSDRLRHAPIERFLTSIELERHSNSKDIFLSHTWLTSGRQVVFVCNLFIALWHSIKLASSMAYSFQDRCQHVPPQVKSGVASLPIGLEICSVLLVAFSDLGWRSGRDRGSSSDFQARFGIKHVSMRIWRDHGDQGDLDPSLIPKWPKSIATCVTFVIFSVLEVSCGHVGLSGQATCHPLSPCVLHGVPSRCLVSQGDIHISCWPLIFGFFGTFLGLVLSPYANRLSQTPKMCFLDLVSIHQTDQAGGIRWAWCRQWFRMSFALCFLALMYRHCESRRECPVVFHGAGSFKISFECSTCSVTTLIWILCQKNLSFSKNQPETWPTSRSWWNVGSMDWVASCKSRRNFEYCGVHPTYRGSGPWAERTRGYRNLET